MNRRHLLLFTFAIAAFQAFASEPSQPPSSRSRQASTAFDGHVFFSASERRALETKPAAPDIPAPQAAAPLPPKRRFDGLLWRDGRIVALWFDGIQADPATEPAIRIGDGIPVTTISGRRQALSPGQSWPPQNWNSGP